MGAPMLWAPGIFAFFLQENLHVHKTPRFRGGGVFGFFFGGGSRNHTEFIHFEHEVCVCNGEVNWNSRENLYLS